VEFCYEKISIEMCIFLREFLPNIGLTSLGPVSMLMIINMRFRFIRVWIRYFLWVGTIFGFAVVFVIVQMPLICVYAIIESCDI
jgi:hypothetical protein